jgi:hypothetical protein
VKLLKELSYKDKLRRAAFYENFTIEFEFGGG